MIVVKVELWPLGDSSKAYPLGQAEISNDGTGTQEVGNYNVKLYKWGDRKEIWRRARVEKFNRKKLGPWDLLLRALQNTVGGRV